MDYQETTNSQIQASTNKRIYSRNIPSQPLQPYFTARPTTTKFSILPIVNLRKPINVPIKSCPIYTPQTIFNPGNDHAPWSGYALNINVESELKNQLNSLQKCSQNVYIPDSSSNLYNIHWKNEQIVSQPFVDLFKTEKLYTTKPDNINHIGHGLFNNTTRQQLNQYL